MAVEVDVNRTWRWSMVLLAGLATACGSSKGGGSGGAGGAGAGGSHPGTGGRGPGSGGHAGTGGSMSSSTNAGGGGAGPVSDVHLIGRVDSGDPAGPRFSWPASAIVTRFSGTDLTLQLSDGGDDYFAVVVDGGAPTVLHTMGGQTDYPIAQGLTDGEHDVWIEKRTESFQGTAQFLGFTTNTGGKIVKTPEPFSRKIEFVGDSITCGYGNEGMGPGCGFTAATEDEYLAWGAVAARALSAEHFGISYSGIGVYRDYSGSTTDQMPVKYERTFADDPNSTWDFSWIPDIVVVDLGTNDFASGDPGQAYVDAYTMFAQQIRGHYPKALILCAVGSMLSGQNLTQATQYAHQVIAARATAGDSNMDFVDLGVQDGNADGYGCDYHPTVATDQKMADKLVTKIKALKNW